MHCGGIDRAAAVYGDTFRRRKFRIRDWRRWDIELNLAVFDAAATNSSLAAGIVRILARRIFGFGIRDVKHVVLIDENPAGPSELFPGREKLAVPIEDGDAAVAAVGDEEPALTIEGKHVRALQFTVA